MLTLLFKFIAGVLLSGWLYAEALYFFPDLEGPADKVVELTAIPTHNRWPDIWRHLRGKAPKINKRELWEINSLFDKDLVSHWERNSAPLFRTLLSGDHKPVNRQFAILKSKRDIGIIPSGLHFSRFKDKTSIF